MPSRASNLIFYLIFPPSSVSEKASCNAGDLGLIPGSGRFPGEENGNPLQYSCLEHSMDRGAWRATVHGVAKSQTWLSDQTTSRAWPLSALLCSIQIWALGEAAPLMELTPL